MGGTAARPWTVSQVNGCLNQLLARALPPAFFIAGEISNYRTYDRGHAFFTLKDAGAEIPCILWKDGLARLKFRPADGMAVIVRGAVRLYEPQGKVQVYVETMLPQGAGALELAYRQLCDKLRREGLFEPGRKRRIPRVPLRVVVMTSRTGDVLHDVLTTAQRRFPGLQVLLYPVRVQGAQAAPDIVRAIEAVNRWNAGEVQNAECGMQNGEGATGMVDLILLVRGGGSLEDLWAFNEESVARAIVASRIPIATGIGHEPDTTIADWVGDLRGPTPTGVTELTIPDARGLSAELLARGTLLTRDMRRFIERGAGVLERAGLRLMGVTGEAVRERAGRMDLLRRAIERIEPRHAIAQGWRRVEEAQRSLGEAMRERWQRRVEGLERATNRLERGSPRVRIERQRDRVEHLRERLRTLMAARCAAAGQRVGSLTVQLNGVSPQAVLERGYSITTDREGRIVRSAGQVSRGEVIRTKLADGEIMSTVGRPRQERLF